MKKLFTKITPMVIFALCLMTFGFAHANEDHAHGRKILFMGHSFFRDTVQYMPIHAENYGLIDHEQKLIMKGGERGAPGSLWANTGRDIEDAKESLRNGEWDSLAMTYFNTNSSVADFSKWFDIAVKGNPDISLYVYLPWMPYGNQSQFMYNLTTKMARTAPINIIKQLRNKYSNNKVYCVPMGDLMPKLWDLKTQGKLKEITKIKATNKQADYPVSLFMDSLGHAGEIPSREGAMFWLASLYNVDLTTYDHQTGTKTDLRPVLQQIMINEPLTSYHDPEAPTGRPGSSLVEVTSIGNLIKPAAMIKTGSIYTMAAAGNDIWGRSDSFGFAETELVGDGEITVQVMSVENIHAWTKAGVMIRETLDANSKNASVVISANGGVSFQGRRDTAAITQKFTKWGVETPAWVKLKRAGDYFTASYSVDGEAWTQLGPSTKGSMPETVYVGLCFTSHNSSTEAIAEFKDLTID